MPTMSKTRPKPSGLASCWMLWRHCCCTYGFYPLIVAPIVTIAFLVSVYSSSGCQFIEVDVGFTPNNRAWNESELDLGFFFQYRPDLPEQQNARWTDFRASCHPYSTDFEQDFTDVDRTWKVARIMSYIATASGLLASVIAWAIVVLPLPSDCLWPGLLLPCVILAFIGEGSKFLFLDIALCRAPIWFPTGVDSLPTPAESCMLGWSAYACIVAGVLQGIGLLMVCLKAPAKRHLDPGFGASYRNGGDLDVEESQHIDLSCHENPFDMHQITPLYEARQPTMEKEVEMSETSREEVSVDSLVDSDIMHKPNSTVTSVPSQDEQKWKEIDMYQNGVKNPVDTLGTVSESRLSVMSKIEQSAFASQKGDELLVNQLISDLDASFNGSRSNTLAQTE